MTEIPKKKILLVDDDSFLLNMYCLKFEKSNYEVVPALSSQDAISKLKDGFKPDILIFDVVMPGMDGIDLLSAVRSQHLADQAKCLMLTNQGELADIERARKIGIDGYIVKATSIPSEVTKVVDEILNKK
jgi:DNA-binding response OmpR family regulator